MSGGSFRRCPWCDRLTLNQRCDNPACTGPGARVTHPTDEFEQTNLTPYIEQFNAHVRELARSTADQMIPSEVWDACIVPAWTRADEVALRAIECGFNVQPWQFDVLAAYIPNEEPR